MSDKPPIGRAVRPPQDDDPFAVLRQPNEMLLSALGDEQDEVWGPWVAYWVDDHGKLREDTIERLLAYFRGEDR